MGYVHITSKIRHLWDPVEGLIILTSNFKFDATLIAGKRVINKPFTDTLHDLANPESQSIDLSEDENIYTSAETIASGLLIEVQQ